MHSIAKLTASALAFGFVAITLVGPASADVIKERQAKMKTMGQNLGKVGKMAKGEAEFDAEMALAAFVAIREAADGFTELFPDGTQTGGDTEASPKIWSDRAGFEQAANEFGQVMAEVSETAPADLEALKASLGMVGKQCGSCHRGYRVKK